VRVSVELINPEGLSEPGTYTHVAIGRGSRIVYISGQVGFDEEGNLVGEGNHIVQAQQAYRNLATAVEAVGGTVRDIAKITVFVVGHRQDLVEPLREARNAVFGDHKPASTFLGVEKLIYPTLLIEVEAVAVLD
jgi:enamine deaminase RidA (YjgF/YER057c/UK114 family)